MYLPTFISYLLHINRKTIIFLIKKCNLYFKKSKYIFQCITNDALTVAFEPTMKNNRFHIGKYHQHSGVQLEFELKIL